MNDKLNELRNYLKTELIKYTREKQKEILDGYVKQALTTTIPMKEYVTVLEVFLDKDI